MDEYADYKNLIVWQKSRILVKGVYELTRQFPKEELFGLTNQIRRAVISIPSNIAEGYNRHSDRDVVHFLRIAKGSAAETETQLLLSMDLGYATREETADLLRLTDEILRMLGALIINRLRRIGPVSST